MDHRLKLSITVILINTYMLRVLCNIPNDEIKNRNVTDVFLKYIMLLLCKIYFVNLSLI